MPIFHTEMTKIVKTLFQFYFHLLHHVSIIMMFFLCVTSIWMNNQDMCLNASFSWPGIHIHAGTGTRLWTKYLKLGQSIKHILIEIMPPLDFGFQPYFVWKPRTCGYMPDFHDLASIYMLELVQDSGQNIWNSDSQSSISWLK